MSTRRIARSRALACALIGGLLGACATPAPPPRSGFLNGDPALRADRYGNGNLLWWEKPGFDWKRYKYVMLDPVAVSCAGAAKDKPLDSVEVERLADELRAAVAAELQDDFPVVDQPGTDVLRIRAAMTEVIPASPALNVVTTVLAFVPLDMGGAAIEAEFIDSVSNERMAAMAERKLGTPFDVKSGFTSLGHARAAFRAWARELKHALDTGP